jgi:hypothetical protein
MDFGKVRKNSAGRTHFTVHKNACVLIGQKRPQSHRRGNKKKKINYNQRVRRKVTSARDQTSTYHARGANHIFRDINPRIVNIHICIYSMFARVVNLC